MSILAILIPVTLLMGAVGLAAFFWSVRADQYEDLSGDAARILFDEDKPLLAKNTPTSAKPKETTP